MRTPSFSRTCPRTVNPPDSLLAPTRASCSPIASATRETDRDLVDGLAVGLRDPVDQIRRGNGSDRRARLRLEQGSRRARRKQVLVEIAASGRDDGDTVGVAVVGDPEVDIAFVVRHGRDQVPKVLRGGFGRTTAELGVALAARALEESPARSSRASVVSRPLPCIAS